MGKDFIIFVITLVMFNMALYNSYWDYWILNNPCQLTKFNDKCYRNSPIFHARYNFTVDKGGYIILYCDGNEPLNYETGDYIYCYQLSGNYYVADIGKMMIGALLILLLGVCLTLSGQILINEYRKNNYI